MFPACGGRPSGVYVNINRAVRTTIGGEPAAALVVWQQRTSAPFSRARSGSPDGPWIAKSEG